MTIPIQLTNEAFRPVVQEIVAEVLTHTAALQAGPTDQIGYTQVEAAALIGVEWYALRDARLRGEVSARKVGRRLIYAREELERYVAEKQE